MIDTRLLVLLDTFRAMLGQPVVISPAPGAVGRRDGPTGGSQHNIDRWGEVRAVDILLPEIKTVAEATNMARLAVAVGFTGVGFYPDWNPRAGLHLDVRRDKYPGDPALWGGVRDTPKSKQRYVSLQDSLNKLVA